MDILPGSRTRRSAQLREEIGAYLEERAAELMAEGMGEEEAWERARQAFGDINDVEAQVHAIHDGKRRRGSMRDVLQSALRDARNGARGLIRAPGFTLVALATLALGLGANTAVYSLVNAALFRAPPVDRPDELIALYTTSRRGFPRSATSYPDFLDYRERGTTLEDLAATSTLPASLGHDERGSRFLSIQVVTGNYFGLLGAPVLHGRGLSEGDDVTGAGSPVAVLSHDLWQEHFLGDEGVVGTDVRLNGVPFTVVGIARHDFRGLELSFQPDAWIPMQAAPRLGQGSIARPDIWEDRGSRWMGMSVGRRVDGATTDAVRDQFTRISEDMKAEYGDLRGPRNTTVDPLDSYALPNGAEEHMSRLVWLLLGVVGFTLLLACANLANLLLARGTIRAKDLSVRAALGARRRDLVRQLLVENVLVAAVGGVLGMAVALAILRTAGPLSLPGGLTIGDLNPVLDGSVLVYTALVTLLTAVLFGLLPALNATRTDLQQVLRDGGRGASGRGHRMRKSLVAVQVALCLLLLIASGLFVATIRNGMAHDPGFRPSGLALARFNLGLLNYEPPEAQALLTTLTERVAARPGVTGASYATRVPLLPGGAAGFFFEVPGYQPRQDEELRVDLVGIGPNYFETLGVPLLAGSTPGPDAGPNGPPQVVISRTMAETYWADASPVGRTVVVGGEEVTVIGVVGDVSWQGLDDEPTNFLYVPLSSMQDRAAGFVTLAVRSMGDPSEALALVRTELTALEPDAPITVLSTMEGQIGQVLSAQQTGAAFLTGFGALALLLSVLGIGGVVAYVVQQRRRDIGIRMALGANGRSVLAQSTLDMALPILVGTVAGILASLLLTRTIEGFLFGVTATDAGTYVSTTVVFLVVAVCAAALPARRATRVNPVEVLTGD